MSRAPSLLQYLANLPLRISNTVVYFWGEFVTPYLLITMIVLPLLYLVILMVVDKKYLRKVAFTGFGFQLCMFFFISRAFDTTVTNYQFCYWFDILHFEDLNFAYVVGLDGLSFYFVFLVPFLLFLALLSVDETMLRFRELLCVFYLIDFTLLNTFSVLDFALFFFFIEFSVVPMFLLIGIWGSRTRRIVSAYTYYFFSLLASVSMLMSIIYLYKVYGTTSLFFFNSTQFNIEVAEICSRIGKDEFLFIERLIWFGIFFSLAVKMPLYPFHIWLPEAHGEASTAGSVILAGLFLKMAGYGLLRFLVPIFPNSSIYFQPYIFVVCLMGVIYCSLILFRQFDLKKFIAYSSVIHMNLTTIAIFCPSSLALQGAIFSMLTHSVIASFLFFSVGIIYDRFHSRLVPYYSDLVERMPNFCMLFFTALAANCAFPLTIGFVSELMLLLGIGEFSLSVLTLCVVGMGLTGIAHYFLINKLIYSNKTIQYDYHMFEPEDIDIHLSEYAYILPLFYSTISSVFFVSTITQYFEVSITALSVMRDSNFIN